MIWKQPISLEHLNALSANTLSTHLGIEIIGYGDDYLQGRMPVDHRTVQPFRILHGGASVALAESLGSVASVLCLNRPEIEQAVGIEINANHLSSVREGGYVIGTVKPLRIGRRIHVWQIDITDENGKAICSSRLTIAIVERPV
ncbi:MAG: hotdog fold thioesterase [Lewinellaceae bacterium]|nr:hotdog fold thioesterase [Lewinellaceae bacterium]